MHPNSLFLRSALQTKFKAESNLTKKHMDSHVEALHDLQWMEASETEIELSQESIAPQLWRYQVVLSHPFKKEGNCIQRTALSD